VVKEVVVDHVMKKRFAVTGTLSSVKVEKVEQLELFDKEKEEDELSNKTK
jgi:hypothetical protein